MIRVARLSPCVRMRSGAGCPQFRFHKPWLKTGQIRN